MTYDPQKYHRRSLRLKGYDYSQAGAYFVTVCVQDRACLFGEVFGEQMHLNEAGQMVLEEWNTLPVRFSAVELDVFCVMPNHVHGILVIECVGAGLVPAPSPSAASARSGATTRVAPTPGIGTASDMEACERPITETRQARLHALGDVVGAFKSFTTGLYIHGVRQSGWPGFRGRLWQRNYHDHIIRSDESLQRIRQYILDNPACWETDPENPQAVKKA